MSVLGGLSLRRRLVLSMLVVLLVGVAAGFVWLWLAQPAEWEVRSNGIVLTEAESTGQFAVVAVFVLIGAIVSLVWAVAVTLSLDDPGWAVAPFIAAGSVLAALVAWRIGVELGPSDPRTVTGAAVGDHLPARLAVDGLAPFLVWPMFGLAGLIAATWVGQRRRS